MNELERLEEELRAWHPRRPPASLRKAIADRLASAEGTEPWAARETLRKWAWGLAAAAAGLVVGLLVWTHQADSGKQEANPVAMAVPKVTEAPSPDETRPPQAEATSTASTRDGVSGGTFHPVSVARILTGVEHAGWISLEENLPPVEQVRYRYVDHARWHDPIRNISVQMTRPREKVVLVAWGPD